MIIYQGTKSGFLRDHDNHDIEDVVATAYLARTGRYVPHAEIRSWKESLGQMAKVLRDEEMPDDMGVGIEYGIPQTAKHCGPASHCPTVDAFLGAPMGSMEPSR